MPQITVEHEPQIELDKFIARLKNIHSTKNILVVGHTNTVPAIVQALSGQQTPAIAETEYNKMYIITINGKERTLIHTTYGR